MNINLSKFSEPVHAVVPLFEGRGVYKGRKIQLKRKVTGICMLELGNEVVWKETLDFQSVEVDKFLKTLPRLKGIAYGDMIIPLNFSSAKFLGYEEVIHVEFMNAELGSLVDCRRWEDKRLLFKEADLYSPDQQLIVLGAKERAEQGGALEPEQKVAGLTPEIRYFYIMVMLDRQRMVEWKKLDELELSKKERERRIKKFKESFSGRLKSAIEDAGGSLVSFNKRGDRIDVKWTVQGELFSSTVSQDFRVLELGFCAEGHDKDHSMSSAVLLAEQFIRDGVIYKTRE